MPDIRLVWSGGPNRERQELVLVPRALEWWVRKMKKGELGMNSPREIGGTEAVIGRFCSEEGCA